MWRLATTTLLVTGLIAGGVRASDVSSTTALNAPPELVSPYQAYNLNLRPFYPMPNRPGGLFVYGRINGGRTLRLVLDSGAAFIVVGRKAAHSVDLSADSEIELVGLGSRPAKVGRAATLEIGPVSFRNCQVALVDGSVVEGADGVIPLSLFADFLLRLDLPRETLRLIPYAREQDPATPSTAGVVRGNALLVASVLNGERSGYVVLDTGAFCSAVSREVARTLRGPSIVPEVRVAAGTGAATGQLVSSTVHFAIAEQDLIPNELVAVDLSNLSRHYGVEVMGVLGFPALSHYILTVDYRNAQIKIESPQSISAREPHRGHKAKSPEPLALR
jgi:hypothetical protein